MTMTNTMTMTITMAVWSLVAHVSSTAVEGGLGSVERDRGGWSLRGVAWSNEESEILNRRIYRAIDQLTQLDDRAVESGKLREGLWTSLILC